MNLKIVAIFSLVFLPLHVSRSDWAEPVTVEPGADFFGVIPVRLIPYDETRIDPFTVLGKPNSIITGPYWTRIFSNDQSIEESFTISSAELESVLPRGMFKKVQYTYSVEGTLQCMGNTYNVSTRGEERAAFAKSAHLNAMRLAIQQGVKRAAAIGMDHIEACHRKRPEPKDVYSELEKLGELRDKGILTDEEFEQQKKRLLDAQ